MRISLVDYIVLLEQKAMPKHPVFSVIGRCDMAEWSPMLAVENVHKSVFNYCPTGASDKCVVSYDPTVA